MLRSLSVSTFSLFIILTGAPKAFAANPCEGKHGAEPRTLFDYRNRIDLAFYNLVPGNYQTPRLGGPRDIELQQQARDNAYAEAFSLTSRLGLSYQQAMPHYLEGYRNLRSRNDQSILRQAIKIYREWEIIDWDQCKYTYNVELAVPKVPELGGDLDAAVREVLANKIKLPSGRAGEIKIPIRNLVETLLEDPSFRERLRAKLADDRFKEDLRYRDDDTQTFLGQVSRKVLEVSGYPKGQFKVNAITGSIIRQSLLPVVQYYLQSYTEVEVACEGYADQLRISGGIRYDGSADLGALGTGAEFSPGARKSGGAQTLIRTNDQLSVARAYEGIAALASALGRQTQNSSLKLRYSGQGTEEAPKTDNPAGRKIVFRISYKRPRG